MKLRERFFSPRGILCSAAIAMVYCISVLAMQPVHGQSLAYRLNAALQPPEDPNSPQTDPQAAQSDQQKAKSVVIAGTIVKNGYAFVLRDASGTVYKLDDQDKVRPFEGKTVKVTGTLEASNNLVHVESIEESLA